MKWDSLRGLRVWAAAAGCGAPAAAAGCVVAAVLCGCETRVIRSDGIGARSMYPTTHEPAGSDPLSRELWGDPKR